LKNFLSLLSFCSFALKEIPIFYEFHKKESLNWDQKESHFPIEISLKSRLWNFFHIEIRSKVHWTLILSKKWHFICILTEWARREIFLVIIKKRIFHLQKTLFKHQGMTSFSLIFERMSHLQQRGVNSTLFECWDDSPKINQNESAQKRLLK